MAATVAARSAVGSAPARSSTGPDDALAGVEQREQQVLGLDHLVAALLGDAGRAGECLLGALGGLVHGHQTVLLIVHPRWSTTRRYLGTRWPGRRGDGTSCPRPAWASASAARFAALTSSSSAARSRARRSARSSRCSSSSTRSTPARLRPCSESSWMRRSSSDVGLAVDPRVARGALRGDEAAALVHAQGLRMHARQLGGDADQEEAGGAAGAHEKRRSRGFSRSRVA